MEIDKQKISVIVPNYNHASYIKQAVESILNQTYDNLEIIIVDDNSTDNSRDVIAQLVKLDDRIKPPIFLKENSGKWFALNTAVAAASGDLITIQDADDESAKQRLELQYKTLKKYNSLHNLCGFKHCYSQEEIISASKYFFPHLVVDEEKIMQHKEVLNKVFYGQKTNGINHYSTGAFETHGASSLYYRQLWEHGMKYMPGNIGLRCQLAEDGDHNTKMTLLLQKTSVIKLPLYAYRRESTTNQAYLQKK